MYKNMYNVAMQWNENENSRMDRIAFIKLVKGLKDIKECSYSISYGNDELNKDGSLRKRSEYVFYITCAGEDSVEVESGWTVKSKEEKYSELVEKYSGFLKNAYKVYNEKN